MNADLLWFAVCVLAACVVVLTLALCVLARNLSEVRVKHNRLVNDLIYGRLVLAVVIRRNEAEADDWWKRGDSPPGQDLADADP